MRDTNRLLFVCGSLLLLIEGVACSLLAWICLSINSLSVSVAELKTELQIVKPSDVLQAVNRLDQRITTIENKP